MANIKYGITKDKSLIRAFKIILGIVLSLAVLEFFLTDSPDVLHKKFEARIAEETRIVEGPEHFGKPNPAPAQSPVKTVAPLTEKAKPQPPTKTAAQLREEQIEGQFTLWDGSHRGLTKYLKANMNDPRSYDHIETTYWDKGDHLIIHVKFRGKNAFGAVVINTAAAMVDLEGNVIDVMIQ
jgi:hypothetical protein